MVLIWTECAFRGVTTALLSVTWQCVQKCKHAVLDSTGVQILDMSWVLLGILWGVLSCILGKSRKMIVYITGHVLVPVGNVPRALSKLSLRRCCCNLQCAGEMYNPEP